MLFPLTFRWIYNIHNCTIVQDKCAYIEMWTKACTMAELQTLAHDLCPCELSSQLAGSDSFPHPWSMIIRMGPQCQCMVNKLSPLPKTSQACSNLLDFFQLYFLYFVGRETSTFSFLDVDTFKEMSTEPGWKMSKWETQSNFDVSCHFIVISYFYRECRLPGWYPPSNWAPGPLQWTEEGLPRPNLKTQCRENASQLAALSLVLLNIRNYSETLPNACDLVPQSTQCLKFETCICRRISQNPKYIFLVSERQCLSPDKNQLFLLLCVFWSQICSLVLST